jgi:predicted Fe-Mo cluster-binding NifX family protein
MKIAVTSQNRKTVTEHAGKCRKFWIYDIENQQVTGKELLELPLEQSFHESAQTVGPQAVHPLDGISLLIAASAGRGLQMRLGEKGIQVAVTTETDPDRAVTAWLNGTLPLVTEPPHDCDSHHGHDHGHDHHHD